MSRDEPSLYILVNQDLKMSRGKVGAQVGHAVQDIVEEAMKATYASARSKRFDLRTYHTWSKSGSRKIVMKGSQKALESHLEDADCVSVRDEGLTEVDPGSLTVVAWFPCRDGKRRFSGYSLL